MEYVESYKSNCLFTKHKEDETPIELVITFGGVLATYNNMKRGCITLPFEVRTWKRSKGSMKQRDETSGRISCTGAGGIIVNFLRPRFGEGILVEFVQKLKK